MLIMMPARSWQVMIPECLTKACKPAGYSATASSRDMTSIRCAYSFHYETPATQVKALCSWQQEFRRGLQQAVRALDEPSMGHRRREKVSEVHAAILAQKALLHSWLAQDRTHSRHMVIQFLEANLQMPLDHVVQAHQQMLVRDDPLTCLPAH